MFVVGRTDSGTTGHPRIEGTPVYTRNPQQFAFLQSDSSLLSVSRARQHGNQGAGGKKARGKDGVEGKGEAIAGALDASARRGSTGEGGGT